MSGKAARSLGSVAIIFLFSKFVIRAIGSIGTKSVATNTPRKRKAPSEVLEQWEVKNGRWYRKND